MSGPPLLRIHLEDGLRESAARGEHNFIGKIAAVAREAGYRIDLAPDTPRERLKSLRGSGHSLHHMNGPVQARCLSFRRVYHYPFWAIEPDPARWNWRVARSAFRPADHASPEVERFFAFWRIRLFPLADSGCARQGYIYVPLQGRLLDHRSFQSCAPIEMLRLLLQHDPGRRIVAALHPRERYTVPELRALDELQAASSRVVLSDAPMERLLAGCDYVATQNSSAAFAGYFFGKPAVLFARIDFHHIAANVFDLGAAEAIERAPDLRPDFAGYLHWFWQEMSINAGHPDAEVKIRAALRRGGMPI